MFGGWFVLEFPKKKKKKERIEEGLFKISCSSPLLSLFPSLLHRVIKHTVSFGITDQLWWKKKKKKKSLINIQNSSCTSGFTDIKKAFIPPCSIKGGNRALQGHTLMDSRGFSATSLLLQWKTCKKEIRLIKTSAFRMWIEQILPEEVCVCVCV